MSTQGNETPHSGKIAYIGKGLIEKTRSIIIFRRLTKRKLLCIVNHCTRNARNFRLTIRLHVPYLDCPKNRPQGCCLFRSSFCFNTTLCVLKIFIPWFSVDYAASVWTPLYTCMIDPSGIACRECWPLLIPESDKLMARATVIVSYHCQRCGKKACKQVMIIYDPPWPTLIHCAFHDTASIIYTPRFTDIWFEHHIKRLETYFTLWWQYAVKMVHTQYAYFL